MSVLNGLTADLDVELKGVDETNSIKPFTRMTGICLRTFRCGSGCSWEYIDYVGNHRIIGQTNVRIIWR